MMRGTARKWYRIPLDPQEKIMLDFYKYKEQVKIYYNSTEIQNET